MTKAKMIKVGGVEGVDVDSNSTLRMMFACDSMGTLGWLRAPFQEAAAVFRFDAPSKAWVLRNKAITFLSAGEGEACPDVGFLGAQPEDATSLLRGGFPTSDAYFAMQGMSLQMSALGYTPKSTDEHASGLLVSRDGVGRDDTLRLAPVFADTFFRGMFVEVLQVSRRCAVTIGKAQTFASEELGDAAGFHGATPVPFKRVLITTPESGDGPEYNLRLRTSREVSIPCDKGHPLPEDGTVVVFTVHMELAGYCSDANGWPLVKTDDNAEAVQAASFAGFAPKA